MCSPPAGKQWTGTARISGKYLKPAWLLPEEVKRDKPSLPNVIPVDAGYGDAEDRTPTHRYEATRRGAMHAFARSWHTERRDQDASDYSVRSCSARFSASIWNGFLRVGRSQ